MDSRRLLLVEPPFYRLYKPTYSLHIHPLSLGYLGSVVRRETTWSVKNYNADFSPAGGKPELDYLVGEGYRRYLTSLADLHAPLWREIRDVIEAYRPDVVGISAKSQNYGSVKIVAGLVKQWNRAATVIVGGPHASMTGREVLDCRDIDIAVRGEGEMTLLEVLGALDRDVSPAGIPGTVVRTAAGDVVDAAPRPLIENLDWLPFPHEHSAELVWDYARYPPEAFARIFAARGCPFNCFFCGSRQIWTRKVRHRTIANVVSEISMLRAGGAGTIRFEDDTFGVSRTRILEICDALRSRCAGLKWTCEMHVNLVADDVIRAMRNAGCCGIVMGVESGNNEILKQIRKGYTVEKAIRAARIIRSHGIETSAFFMVGFPQDTRETIEDTLRAMKEVDCDSICYSIFTPYPGTEAFDYCREKGLIPPGFDVALYNHQSPANHFCENLTLRDLRGLSRRAERFVRWNDRVQRVRRRLSWDTLRKMKQMGFRGALSRLAAR